MGSRFLAFTLVTLLLVFGAVAASLNVKSVYAADDLWYVGEGVKQDMYVKYKIEELDAVDGQPFVLTIYFKEQDENGNWIAPSFVEFSGRVIQGTLKLGNSLARLAGGDNIPEEMNDFLGGYDRSLQWLEAYVPESRPQSLKSNSWGRIAAIGGEEIKPTGTETVTVTAGTYTTTVVGWHKGVDNKIWILNEFPYPVKGETFAEVASGQPPHLFAFELLETGTGEPPIPVGTGELPKPPLEDRTGRGTYWIKIEWEPVKIEPQSDVTFDVALSDSTRFPLERVNYDFTVKDSGGQIIQEFKNQNAEFGIGTHQVKFENAGPMTITVKINSVSGQDTGQFTESANFDVVVVPEFPLGATIVAGSIIGLVVLMTRLKGEGMGSLFGGRRDV